MIRPKIIRSLLFMTPGLFLLSIPVYGGELQIRQEKFVLNMPLTKPLVCRTFVITQLQENAISGLAEFESLQSQTVQTAHTILAVAYFQLGKSSISSADKNSILMGMDAKNVKRDTPLTIIGHTCSLGSEQYNQSLSLQRAQSIARLLRVQGFNVVKVEGKGSKYPVTRDPFDFSKNRRAEIHIHRN